MMAVICDKISIRFAQQGIFFMLMIQGVLCNPLQNCDQARRDAVVVAGFSSAWIQDKQKTGDTTCGENSCCSAAAERDMFLESRRHLNSFVKDSVYKVASVIETRARKFDALFLEMMNTSKLEFHSMFTRTYGKIYLQNADVFSDFFNELENYYKKGSTRLSETLESFFVVLYKRMFTVINSQSTFDEAYQVCIAEHMSEVKPFGDLPHKFATQLRRSFIATRTYYKGLLKLVETARRALDAGIEWDCDRDLVKMRYCGVCTGQRGKGVCAGYCSDVVRKCLRNFVELNEHWNQFVEGLHKIAERLTGPYNIEDVVEPLNIKISEAIMNFQESGSNVSERIFKKCGKPPAAKRRRRRDADEDEDDPSFEVKVSPIKVKKEKKRKNKKVVAVEEDNGMSWEKLVRDIDARVKDTQDYWYLLTTQYCNNMSAPITSEPCYNGTTPLLGSISSNSSKIQNQIFHMHQFYDQMRKAHQGTEVHFDDDDDDDNGDFLSGSGSGSGDSSDDFELERSNNREHDVRKEESEVGFDDVVKHDSPKEEAPRAGGAATISLHRALAQFLLPVALVWFGGAITDLL